MKIATRRWWIAVPVLAGLTAPARADVKPNPLFSEGAVLQRGMPVPVWGTADPGESVTVKVQDQSATATADKDGKWMVKLAELKVGGPYTLTIAGKNTVEVPDVLVGDVWICSGQSNMEWPLNRAAEFKEAAAKSADGKYRLFTVQKAISMTPLDTVAVDPKGQKGVWLASGPDTVPTFSAVGYFFGRDLRKALDVPIGMIHTSWGGTPAEAWTSRDQYGAEPDLKSILDDHDAYVAKFSEADYKAAVEKHKEAAAAAKEAKKPIPPAPVGLNNPHRPTALYNAMIAPLEPYAIKGAIWYQGESNAGRAFQYRTLMPAMIKSWRNAWKQGDFPFFMVQLAPFKKIVTEPGDSDWAELREAQLLTAQTLPKTGMAVITDVGEEDDIHPTKKEPVGARLALAARMIAYGEPIVGSGPVYDGMTVEGDRAILRFKHVGGGLVAKGGPLTGFAIAGEDRKFVNAEAEIKGDTVVVHSDKVSHPVAVRYGWANFPVVNLWNKEGLPATPFRTDDFPITTAPKAKLPAAAAASR
ncbi:sialate O-acetylesterase [Tundrisphaera sp. TA3]|uniref:sialate O-acetylesterase n=1 Tax=Tundrisphaera sp. TA3 TaxID=3435775 RepID=UPI003EBF2735